MMDRDAFLVRVVDDDAAVRDSLEALLVVAGYPVVAFGSAEEYLASEGGSGGESGGESGRESGGEGGCILLDLHMPGMGGLGLLRALAGRCSRPLPVVVLTASREAPLHERARALGARAILTKPVLQATLLATLAMLDGTVAV